MEKHVTENWALERKKTVTVCVLKQLVSESEKNVQEGLKQLVSESERNVHEGLKQLVSESERNVQEGLKQIQDTGFDIQKKLEKVLECTKQQQANPENTQNESSTSKNFHYQVMQTFSTQLRQNLTRTVEIVNMMYQKDKLTSAEREEILQHSNIYTINDNLLKLIMNRPADIYDCFIEALKEYQQTHLYQLLHTSNYDLNMSHAKCIRSHYTFLMEKIDCEHGLLGYLYADDVISYVEKEDISCEKTSFRQTGKLLTLVAMKSAELFDGFLKALSLTGQSHVMKILTDYSTPADNALFKNNHERMVKNISHNMPENLRYFQELVNNKTTGGIDEQNGLCPSRTQNIDFHTRIEKLDKELATLISAKILVLRNGSPAVDPYLQRVVRDAAILATMQPAVFLMKLKIGDLMRGNKDFELRVAETELERNQLQQAVQHLNDEKDNCKVEIKKLVTLLEEQSQKAAEEKHELGNKIREGTLACEDLRKEILNYKQEVRQLKAGVDPKIGNLEDGNEFKSTAFLKESKILQVKTEEGYISADRNMAVLGNKLFAVRGNTKLYIYDSNTFAFTSEVTIPESSGMCYVVSCQYNKCLYINDIRQGIIIVFDPALNMVVRMWPAKVSRLFVTRLYTLLAVNSNEIFNESCILEYTPDGRLVNEISLVDTNAEKFHFVSNHCIQLPDDQLAVSQVGGRKNRVCIVDKFGLITHTYSESSTINKKNIFTPCQMTVDRHGYVMVADNGNGRIVLLSPTLARLGYIEIPGYEVTGILTVCLDELQHRLYVGEYSSGRLFVLDANTSSPEDNTRIIGSANDGEMRETAKINTQRL